MRFPIRCFFFVVLFFHSTCAAHAQLFTRSEPCPVHELFPLARELASRVPVTHTDDIVPYREIQIQRQGARPRDASDYITRTIPLVFLNPSSCELVQSTITRTIRNGTLPTLLSTDDERFIVYVEERPLGILWNWWNTPLQVLVPEGWVVAAVHWKLASSGRSVLYTPGSADLMRSFPTLAESGRYHIRADIREAYDLLANTTSSAFPNKRVPEVIETYFPRLLESIISIEHADDHEVDVYRSGKYAISPIDRPFAVVGANPDLAYSVTKSPAGARGLMQIMPKTCRGIREKYKNPIPEGCFQEPHGHPTELAAAMLVIDDQLSTLMQNLRKPSESREVFARRPQILLMLRASYNTGPHRVSKAVKTKKDWASKLLDETKGYLIKAFGLD